VFKRLCLGIPKELLAVRSFLGQFADVLPLICFSFSDDRTRHRVEKCDYNERMVRTPLIHTSTPLNWLWIWPMDDAVAGVIHELRLLVVPLRSAVTLLKESAGADNEQHIGTVAVLVDALSVHVDQLFRLRLSAQMTGAQVQHPIGYEVAVPFVESLSRDMQHTTVHLVANVTVLNMVLSARGDEHTQLLLQIIQKHTSMIGSTITALLDDGLLLRLRTTAAL
jgi:hypothetical protein